MNGEKDLQIATLRIGDGYLLGVMVPKDNSNWSGTRDCAEFVSWRIYQAAGILYGCNDNETRDGRGSGRGTVVSVITTAA